MEDGEKPSRYFLNMEKRNFVNKTISNIVKEDGSTINDSDAILLKARKFYKNLCSKQEIDDTVNVDSIFDNSNIRVLSNDQCDKIEGLITHKEL